MLGKYDFPKKHIEGVLHYFESLISPVFVWIDLVIQRLEKIKVDTSGFEEIKNDLINMEFLDQFQEVRDKFFPIYEETLLKLLKLERENFKYDKSFLQPRIIAIKEVFLTTDNIMRFCYDFISQKDWIPTLQIVKEKMIERLITYSNAILEYNTINDVMLTPQQREILINLKTQKEIIEWELGIDLIIGIYDDKYSNVEEIENSFESGNDNYWRIMNKLIQMQTLCEIANNIEFNFKENNIIFEEMKLVDELANKIDKINITDTLTLKEPLEEIKIDQEVDLTVETEPEIKVEEEKLDETKEVIETEVNVIEQEIEEKPVIVKKPTSKLKVFNEDGYDLALLDGEIEKNNTETDDNLDISLNMEYENDLDLDKEEKQEEEIKILNEINDKESTKKS
ncbi:hypothetical protein SCHIN_v1c06040 [Spiroplasma chinense]|uniref:Uncharacterized protein n=1 Tax=Spiroplasma chinense TaxID=216932 RepID=A0A5B9Y445_9MOLU|nr:hypothetical protein [Spiroplasma chinense]QEH61801.1 hypothetical protein SCHIN_v1c06040 [Spiroplasma chinense]